VVGPPQVSRGGADNSEGDILVLCNDWPMQENQVRPADPDGLATALLRASRVLVAVSVRSLQDSGEQVTLAQLRMLVALDTRGPWGLTALAADLDVSPSTALRMVDRLVRAGQVRRDSDPDDRRAVVLSVTSEGRELVRRVSVRRREELASILERLPAEQRPAVVAALEAFSDAAGEPPVSADLWGGPQRSE